MSPLELLQHGRDEIELTAPFFVLFMFEEIVGVVEFLKFEVEVGDGVVACFYGGLCEHFGFLVQAGKVRVNRWVCFWKKIVKF